MGYIINNVIGPVGMVPNFLYAVAVNHTLSGLRSANTIEYQKQLVSPTLASEPFYAHQLSHLKRFA